MYSNFSYLAKTCWIIYFSTYIPLSEAVTELDYTTTNSAKLELLSSLL